MTNSIELLKNGVLRWDYSLSGGFFLVWLGSRWPYKADEVIATAIGMMIDPCQKKPKRGKLDVGVEAFLPVRKDGTVLPGMLRWNSVDFFGEDIAFEWDHGESSAYPGYTSNAKWFSGDDLTKVIDAAVEYGKDEFSKLERTIAKQKRRSNEKIAKIKIFAGWKYIGTIYDTETIGALIDEYSIAEHPGEGELRFHDFDTAFDKFMLEYGETIEDTQADRKEEGIK